MFVFLLIVSVLFIVGNNASGFEYVMGNTSYSYSTQAQPPKGEAVVCSTFKTTTRRISDWHTDGVPHHLGAVGVTTGYPRWNPDNYDHRYMLLETMESSGGPSGYVVYRTSDWAFYKDLNPTFYSDTYWVDVEPRWDTSGKHNTRVYYVRGMQLRAYDVESGQEGVIHDFKTEPA